MPLGIIYPPLSGTSMVVEVLWCLIYVLCYIAICSSRRRVHRKADAVFMPLSKRNLNRGLCILSGIALIGGLFLLYEYSVSRGYGFSTPVSDIRMLEINAVDRGRSGSILSGLARFMMPSLLIAWPLFVNSRKLISSKMAFLLFSSTVVVIWVQAMYEGGRFFLVSLIGVTLFSFISSSAWSQTLRPRNAVLLILVLLSAIVYSAYVFVDRVGESRSLLAVYELFASTFDIYLTDYGRQNFLGPLDYVVFPIYMFMLYLCHPLSELSNLIAYHTSFNAYGAYQFPQLAQLLNLIGFQVNLRDFYEAVSRPGVYTTLIGGNYIDFSWLGVFASAVLYGSLTGYALRLYNSNPMSVCASYAPLLFLCSCFAMVHPLVTTVWPAFLWIPLWRVRLNRYY
jgi:hypothetical protein